MAKYWRTPLCTFSLIWSLSSIATAQTTSSVSYLPDLRPRASATTSALDCSKTATGNVSACYPNLNLIPTCCRPCLVNVTLLQPCSSTDFRCLCAHASQIQIQALSCINGTCSTEDEQTAVNYYYSYCNSMNYPLSAVPSSSTPAPTSATTSATATATAIPSPSSSSTSLAPAAAAGIGVTFAAILILAALIIFLLQRRRRKAAVGTRLPEDGGDPRSLDRRDTAPPSYPTVQEIDGKTVHNIALEERPPDAAGMRDLSDSSNASTLDANPARTVYEMDGRRPWSWGRSGRSSRPGSQPA